jgi:hypothetical protein
MMQRMRRSRMPPTSYFVEQLVEGVTKPDTWATVEDPFDQVGGGGGGGLARAGRVREAQNAC